MCDDENLLGDSQIGDFGKDCSVRKTVFVRRFCDLNGFAMTLIVFKDFDGELCFYELIAVLALRMLFEFFHAFSKNNNFQTVFPIFMGFD